MSTGEVTSQPLAQPASPKVPSESGTPGRKDLPMVRQSKTDVDRSKPLPTTLQSDFIPEDILLALTLPQTHPEQLGPVSRRKNVPKKPPAAVWTHPKRREKFRHLVDNTVCVCGAGKDISFLYDIPNQDEKQQKPDLFDASAARLEETAQANKKQPIQLPDTLVPEEYHIVKNKGVMGLEYHDEPYSTQTIDHEKHLVVFPSLNPTSRYEVIQLKKTLDDMLLKAGVDPSQSLMSIEAGETQMHKLLELIKTEQDIYNIVFHEVIRQVSVECIERGELLSAVRQRYSDLLNKVPRQVKSLHEEVMAQRALDRRLTEELMRFKFTIASLTEELTKVKDHDKYVSQQAIAAQEELKRALADSEKNASLLAEYHDLYELQRKRLEFVVSQLTAEKELWSVAAYCLALKVTEEKNLQTAKRLQLCEKAWQKLANHFTIVLSNQDTGMLTVLQAHVDQWRDYIETFNFNMKRREEEMREQLVHLHEDIEEFRGQFATTHLNKSSLVQKMPDQTRVDEYYRKLRSWEQLIQAETERFGGEGLLAMQDDLTKIKKEMNGWTEAALTVFGRHMADDGSKYPDHQAMLDMNDLVHELLNQYQIRLVGDNGVARGLIALSNTLEIWDTKFNTMLHGSNPLPEGDWIRFYQLLDEWSNSVAETVELLGSTQKEDDRNLGKPHTVVEYIDAVKLTQRWASSATNGIDSEDSKLTEQVAYLHTEMTKWMVQMLLRIAPDKEDTSTEANEMALLGTLSIKELKETAENLFEKLYSFTHYVVQCCDNIVKEDMQTKLENHEDNADKEYQELMQLKTECHDWIGVAITLIYEMCGEQLEFKPTLLAEKTSSDGQVTELAPPSRGQRSEVARSEQRTPASQDQRQTSPLSEKEPQETPPTSEPQPITEVEQTPSDQSADQTEPVTSEDHSTEEKADQSDTKDVAQPISKTVEEAQKTETDQPVVSDDTAQEATPPTEEKPPTPKEKGVEVQWLAQDKNTYYKPLEQDPKEAPPDSGYKIEAPIRETPDTRRAYEALAQVDKLHDQVIAAETRAQESEDKTRVLQSELEDAQEKIRALERQLADAKMEAEIDKTETKTETKPEPKPEEKPAAPPSSDDKTGSRRSSASSVKSSPSRAPSRGGKKK